MRRDACDIRAAMRRNARDVCPVVDRDSHVSLATRATPGCQSAGGRMGDIYALLLSDISGPKLDAGISPMRLGDMTVDTSPLLMGSTPRLC